MLPLTRKKVDATKIKTYKNRSKSETLETKQKLIKIKLRVECLE